MLKIKKAIVSVSDKSKIEKFAKGLSEVGVELISTGGTKKVIEQAGIKVTAVADYTQAPEMLDGRVKTLHPKIHAGILAKRNNPEHLQQLKVAGVSLIDMVVVNLYPFEMTINKPDVSLDEAIENIDIGGPTMLRAAAKNYKAVAVVSSPTQYDQILDELKANDGCLSEATLSRLAVETFKKTSNYDTQICNYLDAHIISEADGSPLESHDFSFVSDLSFNVKKIQDLRYGENPHQSAAFYRDDKMSHPSICAAKQLHGKELSFNNILDLNAAIEILKDFDKPMACVLKHNNPCGAAVADSLALAYKMALDCDPMSAYGSIIGLNQVVDEETAALIHETRFIECVVACGYTENALGMLKKKKNIRILDIPELNSRGLDIDLKKVNGGLLLQEKDLLRIESEDLKIVTKRKPTKQETESLMFAWRICKYVKSNAIVLAKDTKTVGIGAGQMSRVDSVIIAIRKAGKLTKDAVMASDAFFPMKDSVEYARKANIKAIIQPGGSIRDPEVIKEADDCGIAMVFTGVRHFKH
ncbi:MAG: bifunctional phosphoribosylaminoimidazolecarboxamide formyltransferase/IMP cyclohydrolase [Candidatus Kappaea frigidicola]|nr:bifunctional phosphoribosylaminoimidazolecarboxamide formyltransferase/IMP cyclohydrolase [Candidatus Kappaea frigidicola]